jgi:hypothetical protein
MVSIEYFKEQFENKDLSEKEIKQLRSALYFVAESVIDYEVNKQIEENFKNKYKDKNKDVQQRKKHQ